MKSEVEETIERIKVQNGVEGYVICNKQGQVLRRFPTMSQDVAMQYAESMMSLASQARGVVRDLNPKVMPSLTQFRRLTSHSNKRMSWNIWGLEQRDMKSWQLLVRIFFWGVCVCLCDRYLHKMFNFWWLLFSDGLQQVINGFSPPLQFNIYACYELWCL